jgi:uncharacterized RDD family membrane protein YckC
METVLDQVCASCGSARQPYGRYCLFCGDVLAEPAKPNPISQPTQPVSPPRSRPPEPSRAPVEYGGFWRRTWAGIIDVVLEAGAALVVAYVIDMALDRIGQLMGYDRWMSKVASGMAYILVLSVGAWLYCAFAESSSRRATIGKRIMGLQVVNADGGKVSFGQATIRHFMKFLSLFTAGVGFMMAGWTKRHQALHDIPCDCVVIRVPQGESASLNERMPKA